MGQIEVDRSRMVLAVVLSFLLWGSGRFFLRRERVDLLVVALHLYIYFLLWLFSEFWLLYFPVIALGGAYFALDLGRRFSPRRVKKDA